MRQLVSALNFLTHLIDGAAIDCNIPSSGYPDIFPPDISPGLFQSDEYFYMS